MKKNARTRRSSKPVVRRRKAISSKNLPITLYILSDSTGNLARHMLTAFLTQFPPHAFEVRTKTFLQDQTRLSAALDEVQHKPGIVFHALVSADSKGLVVKRCREMGSPCCDLTGEFVSFLARETGLKPCEDHRLLHHVDEVYQRRIRAIEYTLEHDDGLGADTLHEADLVLVGVSRTSKTPTSIYLAQQGYKVANISLAMGSDPPRQLFELPPKKVVGLIIDPSHLVEIRSRRLSEWRMASTSYNDLDEVRREIAWSRQMFTDHNWPILNVTDQAIEETAAKILNVLGLVRGS